MNKRKARAIGLFCVIVIGLNILLLPRRYAFHARTEISQKMPLPQIVRAGGMVEPKRSFIYKAEFDGPVLSKQYKEGDLVQKGQLLLSIGRDKIQLGYEKRVNALENAKADLQKARKDARVAKMLYEKGAVALSNVEDAERWVVRAGQALKAAEEEYRLERNRWNSNKLYAAFDGTIVKDYLGDEPSISDGKDLAVLADVTDYSVVAKVDELEIGQVHIGQKAEVHIEAFEEKTVHGEVTDVGTTTGDAGIPEIPVVVTLEKAHGLVLRPKLTSVVYIFTGQAVNVLSVPLTALSNANGDTRVWVLDRLHRIQSRHVVLGRQSNPERVEVAQGLTAGERVCVTADPRWLDGMKVIIDE